jgi:hypothetical protein
MISVAVTRVDGYTVGGERPAVMSEVYNPETVEYEQLEALAVEARQLLQKRGEAHNDAERAVLDRQLREVEDQVEALRRRLRP